MQTFFLRQPTDLNEVQNAVDILGTQMDISVRWKW